MFSRVNAMGINYERTLRILAYHYMTWLCTGEQQYKCYTYDTKDDTIISMLRKKNNHSFGKYLVMWYLFTKHTTKCQFIKDGEETIWK